MVWGHPPVVPPEGGTLQRRGRGGLGAPPCGPPGGGTLQRRGRGGLGAPPVVPPEGGRFKGEVAVVWGVITNYRYSCPPSGGCSHIAAAINWTTPSSCVNTSSLEDSEDTDTTASKLSITMFIVGPPACWSRGGLHLLRRRVVPRDRRSPRCRTPTCCWRLNLNPRTRRPPQSAPQRFLGSSGVIALIAGTFSEVINGVKAPQPSQSCS